MIKILKKYWHLIILFLFVFWLNVTTLIQAIKCPSMTQTEIFLNIPNSFILNFKE